VVEIIKHVMLYGLSSKIVMLEFYKLKETSSALAFEALIFLVLLLNAQINHYLYNHIYGEFVRTSFVPILSI
jgi:hypothetical protein